MKARVPAGTVATMSQARAGPLRTFISAGRVIAIGVCDCCCDDGGGAPINDLTRP